jgi:hypothetical protein
METGEEIGRGRRGGREGEAAYLESLLSVGKLCRI